jgi:hypothetical protein
MRVIEVLDAVRALLGVALRAPAADRVPRVEQRRPLPTWQPGAIPSSYTFIGCPCMHLGI